MFIGKDQNIKLPTINNIPKPTPTIALSTNISITASSLLYISMGYTDRAQTITAVTWIQPLRTLTGAEASRTTGGNEQRSDWVLEDSASLSP